MPVTKLVGFLTAPTPTPTHAHPHPQTHTHTQTHTLFLTDPSIYMKDVAGPFLLTTFESRLLLSSSCQAAYRYEVYSASLSGFKCDKCPAFFRWQKSFADRFCLVAPVG